jgi:hypothetical protein
MQDYSKAYEDEVNYTGSQCGPVVGFVICDEPTVRISYRMEL